MTERPMLMQGWGVRAIRNMKPGVWPAEAIDPSKPIKWQTRRVVKPQPSEGPGKVLGLPDRDLKWIALDAAVAYGKCPHGVEGGRLWVRENFYVQPELWASTHGPQPIGYAAEWVPEQGEAYVQKPSIHMPRWACRETLLIKEVRVQRVQDISGEDAEAEGLWEPFNQVWDKINATRGFGWDKNPWVWCLSFMREE